MKYKNYLRKLIFPLEPKKKLEQRGSNIYKRGIHFNAPAVAADRYVVVGQHVTRWASATTENFGLQKPPCHRRSPSEYPRGYASKGLLIRLLQTNQNKQNQTKPSKQNKNQTKPNRQTNRQTKRTKKNRPDGCLFFPCGNILRQWPSRMSTLQPSLGSGKDWQWQSQGGKYKWVQRPNGSLHSVKLTWQWKIEHEPFEDVNVLLKMVIFHCYVSLPEGTYLAIENPDLSDSYFLVNGHHQQRRFSIAMLAFVFSGVFFFYGLGSDGIHHHQIPPFRLVHPFHQHRTTQIQVYESQYDEGITSGQVIATSHDLTPKGS